MTETTSKTFFITGVSTGLGRALAEAALADGHRVVGTLRNEAGCDEFDRLSLGRSFGKRLDVSDTAAIAPAVAEVANEIGAVAVIQAVLPYMRKRRGGHIINITSMGGIIAITKD